MSNRRPVYEVSATSRFATLQTPLRSVATLSQMGASFLQCPHHCIPRKRSTSASSPWNQISRLPEHRTQSANHQSCLLKHHVQKLVYKTRKMKQRVSTCRCLSVVLKVIVGKDPHIRMRRRCFVRRGA